MIDTTAFAWGSAGLLAGLMHALLLWRGVHRPNAWSPLMGMVRLGLVAAVLVASAVFGNIIAAAVGWGAGLIALGCWFSIANLDRTCITDL